MNPALVLRQAASGPTFGPSTPGYVLTVDADGMHIVPAPASGGGGGLVSFNGRTAPAAIPEIGDYDAGQILNTSDAPGPYLEDAINAIWALVSRLAVSGADTTPGFLGVKLVAGAGLQLTTLNPSADESLQIDILTPFEITSFGTTGATVVLIGSSVVSPGFSASYNQAATAVSLTDTEGNNDVIALPGTAFSSPHTFTKTAYGASVTFTDHATGPTGTGSDTAGASIVWGSNVYTGSAVDPGVYNAAFITSLAATLKLGFAGTYAENASALQSVFFCTRTAFGATTANFFVGGFPFACSRVATGVSVTINGVAENFDVFRSDNVGLGSFNLVAQ